jgi:plastocyanin
MDRSRFGQGGLFAAGAAIAVAAAMAVSGADGARAAADHAIYARDANGPCYSTSATATTCAVGEQGDVSIATGDSVTWHITSSGHNAASSNDVAADPAWTGYASAFSPGDYTYTFSQPGSYQFICEAHPGQMKGTITVTGDPVGTPTATATATATVTPTATATATTQPGGGGQTPAPGGTSDKTRPTVRSLQLKALKHAARVTFRLSENATVTIRIKRGTKVLKTARVQLRKGLHRLTLRSAKLRTGRYTIDISARDASGNRSKLAAKSLRMRR